MKPLHTSSTAPRVSNASKKTTSLQEVITFLTHLQSLDFNEETYVKESKLAANDQVFVFADNMKAFGVISYFLFCQLDKKRLSQSSSTAGHWIQRTTSGSTRISLLIGSKS